MAAYGATKRFAIPVAYILLLIPCGLSEISTCDVERCIPLYQDIYKHLMFSGTSGICRKLDEVIECSDNCLELFFPDLTPIFSKTSLMDALCNFDIKHDIDLHWRCITESFHRLLSCVALTGSMTTMDNSSSRHLTCKKIIEILDCPQEVLIHCEEEAVEAVKELFKNGFKSLMNFSCSDISVGYALDLPVNYVYTNNWTSIATCLDYMSTREMMKLTTTCFGQYLQKAANYELYKCSGIPEQCGRPEDSICLPPHLVNDFYIPMLSLNKKCGDEPNKYKMQVQDSSNTASTSYDDSGTQGYHTHDKNALSPRATTYSNTPMDASSSNTESFFENDDYETSTLDPDLYTGTSIEINPSDDTPEIDDSSTISYLSNSSLSIDKEMINDMDYSSTLDYAEKNSANYEVFSFLYLIVIVIGSIF